MEVVRYVVPCLANAISSRALFLRPPPHRRKAHRTSFCHMLLRRACSSAVVARVARVPTLARALSTQTKKTIQGDDFNELRERSLLRHVINASTEGDPDSVMQAMDQFWNTFFNGEGTAEWQLRGSALDAAIRSKQPKTAMEIGAYCGYTAVRMGRLMPAGSKLISVELDPLYAAIATKVRVAVAHSPCGAHHVSLAHVGNDTAALLHLLADGGARGAERPRERRDWLDRRPPARDPPQARRLWAARRTAPRPRCRPLPAGPAAP